MRQQPEIDSERCVRRWRAWGICTVGGELAELTLDVAKASVWKAGGHKVIDFVHEEPADG